MSIGSPTGGEVFIIRVFKETDVSPQQVWSNSYEIRAQADTTGSALEDAAQAIVDFEKAIHQDTARFNRVVISTWQPDSLPYDPAAFKSIPLAGLGAVASPVSAETLPLSACLFVKRQVASGRYGKLFYRRCLDESQVEGRYGDLQLEPAALLLLQTAVGVALGSSGLDAYLDGTAPFRMTMASGVGALPSSIRDVSDLVVAGARLVKWNNRYFDRI